MKIKLILLLLLAGLLKAHGGSNVDADFYIRIFINQFGEGSNGTISVNIAPLKGSEGKLSTGGTLGFDEHKTGFKLYWKEGVGMNEKFVMLISEKINNVSRSDIKKEFIYDPEEDPFIIYSNALFSVKLIHVPSEKHNQAMDIHSN